MIPAAAASELAAGRSGIYLVTLRAGGIMLRAATRPAEVAWGAGYALQYDAPARVDSFRAAVDAASLTGIGTYETVRVEVAAEDVDAAGLQLAGHPLAGAEVEIALWWPGQDYTQRRVLLRGRARSPELLPAGRAWAFSAEATPRGGSGVVGDAETSVADIYSGRLGVDVDTATELPVVLGAVGRARVYKIGTWSSASHGLVAGHRVPTQTAAVYEDGVSTSIGDYSVSSTTSDSGRAVGELAGASGELEGLGALSADLASGGAPRVDGPGYTRTAADVLAWLLLRSGRRVDWQRCRRALAHLATWEIGVALDTEATALSVVDDLAAVLPILAVEGGDGLYYVYADLDLRGAAAELVEGQGMLGPAPGSGIAWTSDADCRTRLGLGYLLDPSGGGDAQAALTLDADTDPLCQLALQLLDEERSDDVDDARQVWRETTARRVLVHRARRRALPWGSVTVLVEPEVAVELEAGDVVLVTSETWGLTRRPALVFSLAPAGDAPELSLLLPPATTLRDGRL